MLAEVGLGGDLDAVGTGSEVGDVQVPVEDLLLGLLLLHGDRKPCLAQLALRTAFGGRQLLGLGLGVVEQDHLHVLLRDGRSALLDLARALVGEERAGGTADIDAVVLVEARVLDRDDGLLHPFGDLVERHADSVLLPQIGDGVALGVSDGGALRQDRVAQLGGVGLETVDGRIGQCGHTADGGHGHARGDDTGDQRCAGEGSKQSRLAARRGVLRSGRIGGVRMWHRHTTPRVRAAVPCSVHHRLQLGHSAWPPGVVGCPSFAPCRCVQGRPRGIVHMVKWGLITRLCGSK